MKLNRLRWTNEHAVEDAIVDEEACITVKTEVAKRVPDLFGWFGTSRFGTAILPEDYGVGWATVHPFYLVTGRGNCEAK